ncbi:MAG: hypothetical protein US31_C0002G0062 [Berkelbacteria bacterium GW2011_GWA1_36_9]|uniref:Uncharacterized protein n=1 Tax=Berkelbacteria bacterium GW2011_GWA1_36_9 TaxID=1618331 RepID=A0A0G0FLP6_9BACT|nr:MAG: hypothetical protein US31_C0002G0062 [Berkelbacteria bacterium GW2011_GWA1_36_9]
MDKPLTEKSLEKVIKKTFKAEFKSAFKEEFKGAFQESFKESFRPAFQESFKESFKPAFQGAFEPYALTIQQDFARLKERDDILAEDVSEIKSDVSDLHDGQQRIEQRQMVEIKRKDFLSIKLDNHEKRIVRLEKNPTR